MTHSYKNSFTGQNYISTIENEKWFHGVGIVLLAIILRLLICIVTLKVIFLQHKRDWDIRGSRRCHVLFVLTFSQFLTENWQSKPSVYIEDGIILGKSSNTTFIYTDDSMIMLNFMDIERPLESHPHLSGLRNVFTIHFFLGFPYIFLFIFLNVSWIIGFSSFLLKKYHV